MTRWRPRLPGGAPLMLLAAASSFLLLTLVHECAAGLQHTVAAAAESVDAAAITVHKCCARDEIVVVNMCRSANITSTSPWAPEFSASREDDATAGSKTLPASSVSYKLATGFPNCKSRQQWLVYHYHGSGDRLVLYPSGKLRHYVLKHQNGGSEEQHQRDYIIDHERSFDYVQGFYCLDKVIDIDKPDSNAQVAVICTPQVPSPWTDVDYVMRRVVNPACQAIAMTCLLLVAVVHFVLPQLRDLIGNMVTTLAGCMIVARIANVVRIFVEYNGPISYLMADAFLYISTLSSFFWLNAMGYYIWHTFKSRNVFLRITDGRKYCYYSLYVWSCTIAMGGMAIFAHFILDAPDSRNDINRNYSSHPSSAPPIEGAIGWLGVAVIFVPVMCTILVNLFFYFSTKTVIKRMSTYGQIHHKMKYSFDMFSKLFAIMIVDLTLFILSWTQDDILFYVHVIFNPIQTAFILYVTVIRPKRVKFLLRKACCYEHCILPCCRPKETDVQAGTEWGEEMMAFNTSDY
ncbi:Methuselah ectodomain, domain 2,GPCR, family 2-like [Cinara cedri]|uniref:Methuselah ectodomain, domain 2,GPCR, family 2-like n=1 Tax=Cinara cedri TaxID=506608 RepID=A0A5E4M995_9HEMI|nr:Methuselah ectodomain, domain 2,GPCR, family 2-like [Cinara cedri]